MRKLGKEFLLDVALIGISVVAVVSIAAKYFVKDVIIIFNNESGKEDNNDVSQ